MKLPWTLADDGLERVWSSAKAASGVIEQVVVEISTRLDRRVEGRGGVRLRKGEWHRTRAEALAAARMRVQKRIDTIDKARARLIQALARLEVDK